MAIDQAAARLARLRLRGDTIDQQELAEVWADLAPVRVEELLGAWRGALFDTGHPHNRRSEAPRWHGKHFVDADNAKPNICVDADGSLYASGAGASLWMIEFRGEVTASLVYDDEPVLDHFKRVDDANVVGVMNRRIDRQTDTWLYFWLEREDVPFLL